MYRDVDSVMFFFLHVSILIYGIGATADHGCPPWMYRPLTNSSCQCGSSLNGNIQCINSTSALSVHMCMCLTYNPFTNRSIAGHSSYSCIANLGQPSYQLPMRRENFTSLSCGVWNREGPLCSKCITDHRVPLYTYDLMCTKCTKFQIRQLFKFLAVSLIPPTVLCVVVTIFHFNVLRPPWSGFVLIAQVMSSPFVMQSALNNAIIQNNMGQKIMVTLDATLYGPLNLDFFRALYDPICISPNVTNLQSAAVEGIIGLYPLLLIGVLFILVKLHDSHCSIIVRLWKPMHMLLLRFRSRLNLTTSLIDTFATLILLSLMKIGFAACYILTPTRVWSPNGSYVWAVYYDPSEKYLGPSHIGYALITLPLAFLVLAPVIVLFLYPYRCFQKCLNRFHLRSLALHAFVDAFQGYYKDGTDGTRDCRYFAALQLVLRLLFPVIFAATKDVILSTFIASLLLGVYITAFVIAKPYKDDIYNKSDIPVLMVLLLRTVSLNAFLLLTLCNYHSVDFLSVFVNVVSFFAPLVYAVVWFVVLIKRVVTQSSWCRGNTQETDSLL